MAYFQDPAAVAQLGDSVFEEVHSPRDIVAHSGIYKCTGCGKEIAASLGEPLPAQNHHQHPPAGGPIQWKLAVWAQY